MTQTDTGHEPHIQVLKGNPSDDELAALIAVLGNTTSSTANDGATEHNQWGLAVDRLRFTISTQQRITMQQRARMRR